MYGLLQAPISLQKAGCHRFLIGRAPDHEPMMARGQEHHGNCSWTSVAGLRAAHVSSRSGLDGKKACWMDLGVKPKAAAGHGAEGASVLLGCRKKIFLY